ncbi:AraC family transcriptional regulator [Ruminococcaceae bacterium OttesenSCG-928-L11]|nr:AraC family transcriptional regulator [Ruminococcaceae bacterium OttesenSCG-928-L11]
MNPLAQMNNAMDYLESNLFDEIDFSAMSRIAGCSEYHFRRMFSYLAGMPLGEYIRCRKLDLAGALLRRGDKVIDCAMLLGYESADAFCKAFQVMHGITPSEAKRENAMLKAFPPMTFQLTITGGCKMDYRIVHNENFRIVGFKKKITLQFEGVNKQTADLVQKPTPESIRELKGLCNIEPRGMLSVSANFSDRSAEGTELDQYIAVATTKAAPTGYDVLEVAETDWAVFTVVGPFPRAVQDTWARIYSEWLPSSEYQLTGGPELLWHESPDLTKQDCKSEIWISISKRL